MEITIKAGIDEGKSVVANNIARVFAEAGVPFVLSDVPLTAETTIENSLFKHLITIGTKMRVQGGRVLIRTEGATTGDC